MFRFVTSLACLAHRTTDEENRRPRRTSSALLSKPDRFPTLSAQVGIGILWFRDGERERARGTEGLPANKTNLSRGAAPCAACRFYFCVVGFPAKHSAVDQPLGLPSARFSPRPWCRLPARRLGTRRTPRSTTEPSGCRDSRNPRRLKRVPSPGAILHGVSVKRCGPYGAAATCSPISTATTSSSPV